MLSELLKQSKMGSFYGKVYRVCIIWLCAATNTVEVTFLFDSITYSEAGSGESPALLGQVAIGSQIRRLRCLRYYALRESAPSTRVQSIVNNTSDTMYQSFRNPTTYMPIIQLSLYLTIPSSSPCFSSV